MATAQTCAPRRALDGLPHDALEPILAFVPPRDLASLNVTARLFHAARLPGERSPVEHALRVRARARGHERTLPEHKTLPSGVRTCTEELFERERVLELAIAHASPVSASDCFSAFVDAEGGLHTCGEEPARDEDGHLTGKYRAHAAVGHVGPLDARVPTHVASLSAVRVAAVAAGSYHLLALSDDGTVYACGRNGYGQLGLGDKEERRTFALVDALRSDAVVGISTGTFHSVALTAAGCAYSWGCNNFGQLGHAGKKEKLKPTRIEALDGVRIGGVAAGAHHTLLLSAQGAVYSCGEGLLGRLGNGYEQQRRTPMRIEALASVRAVHVSAGAAHSLVVDAAGSVYSFGYDGRGQLGHGARGVLLSTPRRIEALAGVHALRACAGYTSSAVLGADGSVHTFGHNEYGQLGHDGAGELSMPTRVGALAQARVARCTMGHYHSLFVSADGSVYACGKRSAALGLGMSKAEQDEPTQRIDTPTCIETAWRPRVC